MFGSPKKRIAAALLLATLALGACGDDSGSGGTGSGGDPSGSASDAHDHGSGEASVSTIPAADATVTVEVSLKDFSINGIPSTVEGQKILFKVTNDGGTPHELVLVKGTEELIASPELAAGESADLAVELPPGRYSAKCLIGSGGGRHDKLGMTTNFTVA